jgi:hypothetical protein
MESEFDVLDIAKKLVKYVVHMSRRRKKIRNISLLTRCPNIKRPVFGLNSYGVKFLCATLNCANRWTQRLDELYPLRYFFWTWHCHHVLVNTVHITSHAIRVHHV